MPSDVKGILSAIVLDGRRRACLLERIANSPRLLDLRDDRRGLDGRGNVGLSRGRSAKRATSSGPNKNIHARAGPGMKRCA